MTLRPVSIWLTWHLMISNGLKRILGNSMCPVVITGGPPGLLVIKIYISSLHYKEVFAKSQSGFAICSHPNSSDIPSRPFASYLVAKGTLLASPSDANIIQCTSLLTRNTCHLYNLCKKNQQQKNPPSSSNNAHKHSYGFNWTAIEPLWKCLSVTANTNWLHARANLGPQMLSLSKPVSLQ